jgi:hypothetical protein
VRENRAHYTESLKGSVADQRSKLRTQIQKFRSLQKCVYISSHLASITPQQTSYDTPEDEQLYLPSFFSAADRRRYELGALANYELKLREGVAFDKIRELQELTKLLSVNLDEKRDARGVKANTRTSVVVRSVMASQSRAIDNFNINRSALIRLGMPAKQFPVVMQGDTYRKPTHVKRQLGDSRKIDGRIGRHEEKRGRQKGERSAQPDCNTTPSAASSCSKGACSISCEKPAPASSSSRSTAATSEWLDLGHRHIRSIHRRRDPTVV